MSDPFKRQDLFQALVNHGMMPFFRSFNRIPRFFDISPGFLTTPAYD